MMHFFDIINVLFTLKRPRIKMGIAVCLVVFFGQKFKFEPTQNGRWEDAETTFQIHEFVILVLKIKFEGFS